MKKINLLLHSKNSKNYIKLFEKLFKKVDYKFYDEVSLKKLGDWIPTIVLLNNDEGVVSPDYNSGYDYPSSFTYDESNDMIDCELIKLYSSQSLIISVGRSSHLITTYVGGRLIAHVNNYDDNVIKTRGIIGNDVIQVESGITFTLHSKINQLMYPFKSYCKYKLLAWSEKFQSDYYKEYDGSDHKLPCNYIEPQLIYYSSVNALCFQSHFDTEGLKDSTDTAYYLKHLIKEYI